MGIGSYKPDCMEFPEQLFRQIEQVNPEIVITDCETCSLQIVMNTRYRVLHPVTILAKALV